MADVTDPVAENRRRATVLLVAYAVPIAVVVTLALLLVGLGLAGIVLGLVAGGGAALVAHRTADAAVLRRIGATPADPVTHARLHNLVEGLCVAGGLTKPAIHVVEDDAPNTLVAGTSPAAAVLVVTTGLLARLDRIELEGVLAHQLSRVKQGDIAPATIAVTTVGLLAGPVPGLHRQLLARALGPRPVLAADASAVAMTRYPPGLIAALEQLASAGTAVRQAPPASAHLWLGAPTAASADGDASHPPLDERIATLREIYT